MWLKGKININFKIACVSVHVGTELPSFHSRYPLLISTNLQSQSNIKQKKEKITDPLFICIWFPVCYQLVPKIEGKKQKTKKERAQIRNHHTRSVANFWKERNLWGPIEWYRWKSMTINVQWLCVRACLSCCCLSWGQNTYYFSNALAWILKVGSFELHGS